SPKHLLPFQREIWKFLWNGKRGRINQERAQLSRQQGGLNMINILSQTYSLRFKWIVALLGTGQQPWKLFIDHAFQQAFSPFISNTSAVFQMTLPWNKKHIRYDKLPTQWIGIINAWIILNGGLSETIPPNITPNT